MWQINPGGFRLGLCSLLVFLLWGPSLAEPYSWPDSTPEALLAPSDNLADRVTGAAIQGGLVDLRWGQASIDVSGVGVILQWDDKSEFTLNGSPTTAKDLATKVKTGRSCTAVVRYDPTSGRIGWLDALTNEPSLAFQLWKKEVAGAMKLSVPHSEILRLNLKQPHLFIPGVSHRLALQKTGEQWWATLPDLPNWEWKNIPTYLSQRDGTMYRSRRISYSGRKPKPTNFGPHRGSSKLSEIPCWIDFEKNNVLLNPHKTRIRVLPSGKISDLQIRQNRVHFILHHQGPGPYNIEATLTDYSDRKIETTWPIEIRP